MKNYLIIISLVLFTISGISQNSTEIISNDSTTIKQISLNAFNFTKGLNGEEYRQLRLNYPIFKNFSGQFGFIYDKSISSEIINSSFMLKWYFKEKLYFFGGLSNEYETRIFNEGQYIIRNNLNFGVGYEVNSDFLLELGYHQQINKPNNIPFENNKKQKGFSLRAQF